MKKSLQKTTIQRVKKMLNRQKGSAYIGLIVLAVVASLLLVSVGYLLGRVKGPSAVTIIDGASSDNPTKDHFLDVDGILRITGSSPDGYVLYSAFTVGTTTPVRASLVNSTGGPLMCNGDSISVYASSTAAFAPSFKFALGTTTATGLYSANLIASTTIATSTISVSSIATGWSFLVPTSNAITLSIGDYSAAIASSTYYGNWTGQLSIHCWTMGQ